MEIKAEPSNYCVSQYYDSSLIKQCTKELRHITSQLILRSFLFSLMRRMEDNWPVIPHRAAKPVRRIQPNTGCQSPGVEKLYQGHPPRIHPNSQNDVEQGPGPGYASGWGPRFTFRENPRAPFPFQVRPSLQLLCHLITNYTPLLHDNDVGRRRCNQWPNKTIHHHSHRGNKRGDHRGARISEGHHGRQGHRGNRGDRRRKSRQWHRSNRKYRNRGRHREHRASGPRRGHLAGGSSSRPGHRGSGSSRPRGHHGIGSSTRRGDPDSGRRRRHRARGSHRRDPVSGRRRGNPRTSAR
ncbi:unnamed protein product [Arctogadus glacialis]